jgi:hypothetical protein
MLKGKKKNALLEKGDSTEKLKTKENQESINDTDHELMKGQQVKNHDDESNSGSDYNTEE